MPAKTKSDEPDEGGVTVDSLAADVADETLDYLDGTPVLIPMLSLPRSRRADAYDVLGKIQTQQRLVQDKKGDAPADAEPELNENGDPKVAEIDPADLGTQYRVVVYIEDYLATVAANEQLFRAWAGGIPDSDLIKTFNVYIRKAQPGEAESSTG